MKIVIDPGHGGKDQGAMFRALREADIVMDIALACFSRLQFLHWTVLTRVSDMYVSLADRVQIANSWKADLFVSIHTNADMDSDEPCMPEGKGEEIWIYPGSPARKVAETIKEHVDGFFPDHPFRGIKESSSLYVLKPENIKMPTLLIETGFIDNLTEHKAFQSQETRRRIGRMLGRGLLDYCGKRYRGKTKPN